MAKNHFLKEKKNPNQIASCFSCYVISFLHENQGINLNNMEMSETKCRKYFFLFKIFKAIFKSSSWEL